MPFDMRCNMCGESLSVDEDQVGTILNCPSCGQVIFVQMPAAPAAPQAAAPELRPEPPQWLPPPVGGPAADESTVLMQADTQSSLADMMEVSGEPARSGSSASPAPASLPSAPATTSPAMVSGASPEAEPRMPWESEPAALEPPMAIGSPPAQLEPPVAPMPEESYPWAPAGSTDVPISPPSVPDVVAPPGIFGFETSSPTASGAPEVVVPPSAPAASAVEPQPELPDFLSQGTMAASPLTAGPATTSPISPASLEPKPRGATGSLVFAYASGIILGLIIGRFMFGGRSASPTGLELIRDDGANAHKTQWIRPTEPVPSSQKKRVGETVDLGHLAVTALGVERRKVALERVDPFSSAKETSSSAEECLVMRLRLKNTSTDVEFVPLDEVFLRPHDPKRRPNYSFIELDGGDQIGMYELSQFSEWNIVGQPMQVIRPGEEQEAIVAAESGSADRAKGKMTWRIQVRAGGPQNKSYSTVVGFEFSADDVRGAQSG